MKKFNPKNDLVLTNEGMEATKKAFKELQEEFKRKRLIND